MSKETKNTAATDKANEHACQTETRTILGVTPQRHEHIDPPMHMLEAITWESFQTSGRRNKKV
jgi:hypothetical protein